MPVEYRKILLDNGLTLVVEQYKSVRSVCVGVWVKVGSSLEIPSLNGMSHFLEHMTFKGTANRSALEIATVIESLGGDLNAFTDREVTCYHSTVLKEHVDIALDVLSELVQSPTFPADEIEREKKVLLQELAMIEESPDEEIHEILFKEVWKNHPLGQPVIGTRKNIKEFTRARARHFFETHYRPENMVISVAGNVEFEALQIACNRFFGQVKPGKMRKNKQEPIAYHPSHRKGVANTEQLHLVVCFQGLSVHEPMRFDALVLNFYLGGGMSSRLFQEIREKAGLAYTVDCDFVPYSQAGLFLVYLAMKPSSLAKTLEILGREIGKVSREPISPVSLEQVKNQIRGAILLGAEQMESRQESLGRNEILFGRHIPVEEIISEIDKVTVERVHAVAKTIFVPEKESTITLSKVKPKREEISIFL